jgi:uncharacterized metal-binding protein
MPIYPPRNSSIKKQQELDYLGYQLYLSFSKEETRDKLEKLVEKFRKANLNLLKVKIKLVTTQYLNVEIDIEKIEKLQSEAKYWENITFEYIIENHKVDCFKIIKNG